MMHSSNTSEIFGGLCACSEPINCAMIQSAQADSDQQVVRCASKVMCEDGQSKLEALRIETRKTLEQSWKEVESLRNECLAKMACICRLQSKLGASVIRKCAAIERLARLRGQRLKLKHEQEEGGDRQEESVNKEKGGQEKEGAKWNDYIPREGFVSVYLKRIEGRKRDKIIAENQLKLASRKTIVDGMGSALRESREILQRLRRRRWSLLRSRLSEAACSRSPESTTFVTKRHSLTYTAAQRTSVDHHRRRSFSVSRSSYHMRQRAV